MKGIQNHRLRPLPFLLFLRFLDNLNKCVQCLMDSLLYEKVRLH